MIFIDLSILVTLIIIIISDFKGHVIPNYSICILLFLSAINNYIHGGLSQLLHRFCILILLFLLCVLIGYFYSVRKNEDIAGGGDYKLIASFGFLFGIKGLFVCLTLELIYEAVYRYIIFPEKKKDALPIGTSLGVFGIIVLMTSIYN